MNDAEPVAERLIRVLEDRPGNDREPIAGGTSGGALSALPVPSTRWQVIDGRIGTTRTPDTFRPPAGFQIGFAGILIGKHRLELGDGELVDLTGLFGARHG